MKSQKYNLISVGPFIHIPDMKAGACEVHFEELKCILAILIGFVVASSF